MANTMTTTTQTGPTPSDQVTATPLLFPVAMVLAPILLLASTIAFLTVGHGINNGIVGGVLTVWAVLAFIISFVGCARLLETRSRRGAQFVIFGAAALGVGGAGFGISAIYAQILGDDHGIDAVAAFDAHPFGLLALLPWGWFMPVTCVLAGALLWRAALMPWWHGMLFILGGILFVTGRPARIGAVAIATDVVLLVAFVVLAARSLRARQGNAAREWS